MRLARAAAVLAAAAVGAWFALGIVQARDTDRALAIISKSNFATAADARQARSLLHTAGFLNPDQEIQIMLGRVAIEREQWKRAIQILLGVTRAEPQNEEGWIWLAHASGGAQPLFDRALARARALEPLVPSSP